MRDVTAVTVRAMGFEARGARLARMRSLVADSIYNAVAQPLNAFVHAHARQRVAGPDSHTVTAEAFCRACTSLRDMPRLVAHRLEVKRLHAVVRAHSTREVHLHSA
jgi:hypothetical protein